MPNGTVKWFNDDKGYGFITPDEGGKDLFVHHSGINSSGFRSLNEGSRVSYEAETGPKEGECCPKKAVAHGDPAPFLSLRPITSRETAPTKHLF